MTSAGAINIFALVNIYPAELFAALSHDTRLRCMLLLLANEELCVCELTETIGAAQPHVSRHLAHLRETGLVSDRRDGLWIHYRLNPDLPDWVVTVLGQSALAVTGLQPFDDDLAAFARLSDRPGQSRCV